MSKLIVKDTNGVKYTLGISEKKLEHNTEITFTLHNDSEFVTYSTTFACMDEKISKRVIASISNQQGFSYSLICDKDAKQLTMTINNTHYSHSDMLCFALTEESKKIDLTQQLLLKLNKKLDTITTHCYKQICIPDACGSFNDDITTNTFMKLLHDYLNSNHYEEYKKACRLDDFKLNQNGCDVKNDIVSRQLRAKRINETVFIQNYIMTKVRAMYNTCPFIRIPQVLMERKLHSVLCSHSSEACSKCETRIKNACKYNCIYGYKGYKMYETSNITFSMFCSFTLNFSYFGPFRYEGPSINKFKYDYGHNFTDSIDCKQMKIYDIQLMELLKYYELVLNAMSSIGYHAIEHNTFFDKIIKCVYNTNKVYIFEIKLLNVVHGMYFDSASGNIINIEDAHIVYVSKQFPITLSDELITHINKQYVIYRREG